MPWLAHAEYDRLVRQVESLQESLDIERAENRRTERWQMNMLMRRAGTFPVPLDEPVAQPAEEESPWPQGVLEPYFDQGEFDALMVEGEARGATREDVMRLMQRERGIET